MEKSDLRVKAKELRKNLDIRGISESIVSEIEGMEDFQASHNVLLFYPKDFEINTIPLCEKYEKVKNFYLPKVIGDNLAVCPYDGSVSMTVSKFSIKEPCTAPVSPEIIDYAVIPCLCADRKGVRIGYGGGFYDRFLPLLDTKCIKVLPVPSKLLFECIPAESHDIPVNFVITEDEVVNCADYC
ncbi:5-formyltetrahydrofolate cyclo-ligase [bacterium]|nr:5-formyltetrahydrofolate cyclo-ligase [bacterium]